MALQPLVEAAYDARRAPRSRRRWRATRSHDQGWAINDVVIRGGVRMVDVEVYVDGYYVNTYPGDGMIVATPRGSTAYCMAAGGPILTAGVRGFALVPISCHSPIRTPFIVAEEAKIEMVIADDDEATLILDGRPTEISGQRRSDRRRAWRPPLPARLPRIDEFLRGVRTKFNFQIRPDAVPTRRPSRGVELSAIERVYRDDQGDAWVARSTGRP